MPVCMQGNAALLGAMIEREARRLGEVERADGPTTEVVFSRCARRLRELATRADALADIYQD